MRQALTIAGSDPSGGAGLQADLKVFRRFGLYGFSAVAALTAQNARGVKSVMPVAAGYLRDQLTVLLSEFTPHSMKTGMLYSKENVEAVFRIVKKFSLGNLVVDPVIFSSTGRRLAERGTPEAIRKRLLPICYVVTPNIFEASVLSGMPVKTLSDMEAAAVLLKKCGPAGVIITGGHLEKAAVDILYDGDFHYLRGRKLPGEFHGTGCAFSAAVAALLALGHSMLEAAVMAKRFVKRAIRRSFGSDTGMKLLDI
ncbi:MAG: bifunctional hydroxymethylpyrimidine kinase/phosphomethylpyrimidine kinase [Candidatus Sulfobium sp.]